MRLLTTKPPTPGGLQMHLCVLSHPVTERLGAVLRYSVNVIIINFIIIIKVGGNYQSIGKLKLLFQLGEMFL